MSIRNVLDLSFDPACLAASDGRLLYVNDPFQDALGIGPEEVASVSLAELVGKGSFGEMSRQAGQEVSLFKRLKIRVKDGSFLPVEVHCLRLSDTDELAVVFRPTAGNLADGGVEHLALHDALTGLPNRVLLLDRMRQTLARAKRHKDFVAVVFVDLDGFKPINDNYGHKCGDEVLRVTAARLLDAVRSDDTAARIGGDEFVMILGELRNGLHAGLMGNRVIKSITQPIPWQDQSVNVSASLGISVAPTDGIDPEELLKKADDAMYVAKKSGKNGYSFYNESSYFK
jgi:diguanylate cyclase (GGDEF)-like protein/PAS domain S-box-containing protein